MPKFDTGYIRFFSLNFFSSDLAIRTCMFQKADCFRKIFTKLVVLLCKCVYLCLYILCKCVYLCLYILCKCICVFIYWASFEM